MKGTPLVSLLLVALSATLAPPGPSVATTAPTPTRPQTHSAEGVGPVRAAGARSADGAAHRALRKIKHFIVLFQENNSFDKVYGGWENVDGVASAPASATEQVDWQGRRLSCLPQTDSRLTVPPLTKACSGADAGGKPFDGHFVNGTFLLNDYFPPSATTDDLRHRFYQEQYQINDGRMNRYAVGNDESVGLSMGMWDTSKLPLYKYLHTKGHPRYTILDRFFHSAFGGSFLNHQWLIAARTPKWPGAVNNGSVNDLHSVIDSNAMPGTYPDFPLYKSPLSGGSAELLKDGNLTASCNPPKGIPRPPEGSVCGNFAVNTTQPTYQPYVPGTPRRRRLPPQTGDTIADRLDARGVSWAWYSQGWSNASGRVGKPGWTNGKRACTAKNTYPKAAFPNCPSVLFQFHHQPFNYFKAFDPGTSSGRRNRRAHLRDYREFRNLAHRSNDKCRLRDVSFVKFIAGETEHPAASRPQAGSVKTVHLIRSIRRSDCARNTMIVLTYDENGGSWDHVAPPGTTGGASGPSDRWGPGTRVPAMVISPRLPSRFGVDSVSRDTTSILRTIEDRYRLRPVGKRDRRVSSLSSVFAGP